MSKVMSRSAKTGHFVVGRQTAEKISAVEGIVRTARTSRLIAESDARNETGDLRRARIKAEFSRQK